MMQRWMPLLDFILYITWRRRLQRSRVLVEFEHLAATLNSIKQSTKDHATTREDIRFQMAMLHHVYFRVAPPPTIKEVQSWREKGLKSTLARIIWP